MMFNQNQLASGALIICGNSPTCDLIPKYYPTDNGNCYEGYELKTFEYVSKRYTTYRDFMSRNIKMFDYCINNFSRDEDVDFNFVKKFSTIYHKTSYNSIWIWSPNNYYNYFNNHFYNYSLIYINLILTTLSFYKMYSIIYFGKEEKFFTIISKMYVIAFFFNILVPEILRIVVNWNYNDSNYFINSSKLFQYIEKYEASIFDHILFLSLFSMTYILSFLKIVINKND